MQKPKARLTVKIHYYQPTLLHQDESYESSNLLREKLLFLSTLEANERECPFLDGKSYNIEIQHDSSVGIIYGTIRLLRSDAPSKGKRGTNETQVIQLNADEGISELTMFAFDYHHGVIGIQYNHYGPREHDLSYLINTLYEKKQSANKGATVVFRPIILGTEIESVLKSSKVTAITARLKKPVSEGEVPPNANWQELFGYLNIPETATQEIKITDRNGGLVQTLRDMLPGGKKDVLQFDKFSVNCSTPEEEKITPHDLIKNKLSQNITVDLIDGSKQINTEGALPVLLNNIKNVTEKYQW